VPFIGAQNTGAMAQFKLKDIRQIFRIIGEVRELGADPARWRPHMVRRLRKLMRAEIVISSEIFVRSSPAAGKTPGVVRVHDIGWGCDGSGDGDEVWRIQTERDERPESYWVSVLAETLSPQAAAAEDKNPVAVKPTKPIYGGSSFILSQYPLPHLGAIDQLGLHRTRNDPSGDEPFTEFDHRLVRLFHVELGRLWRKDALKRAKDPASELPPRLAQTLASLQAGNSEKQVSIELGISPHTVHNYVKILHQRLGVSSRGELLAKTPRADGFLPKLSIESPTESKHN
jgi:DNA-binding CsgD family transcriptional regulator